MQLSKCDIFRIKSQTKQQKKKLLRKTFKNGMDDDDVDKKQMYIYRRRCSYFLRHFHIETPRNAHLYIPPFHLWTIKYLDQHVKIGNVFFFYVYPPFSFLTCLSCLFSLLAVHTDSLFFFENESIQPTAGMSDGDTRS